MGLEDEAVARRRRSRRWLAVGLATVLMFLSYTLLIFGFAAASEEEPVFAGGLIGIGLGLVPGVFFAAAALSGHARSIRATLAATGLWFLFVGPIAVLDIPTGLVAGFGAGGVIALRRPNGLGPGFRIAAVAMCATYTFVVQLIVPAAGLMVGAVLPLAAIGLADVVQERETGLG